MLLVLQEQFAGTYVKIFMMLHLVLITFFVQNMVAHPLSQCDIVRDVTLAQPSLFGAFNHLLAHGRHAYRSQGTVQCDRVLHRLPHYVAVLVLDYHLQPVLSHNFLQVIANQLSACLCPLLPPALYCCSYPPPLSHGLIGNGSHHRYSVSMRSTS